MFLAFVFWIGCKWIKKGGLCARGWENREPFFIDLLRGKQLLKTHKNHLCGGERWTGWVKLLQRSVPIFIDVFPFLKFQITKMIQIKNTH